MSGSNRARTRANAIMSSRSRSDSARNRAVSAPSRPMVLTTMAASNDSWATPETSARAACAASAAARMRRPKYQFTKAMTGPTVKPMAASNGSVTTSSTAVMTSIALAANDIGSGAAMKKAASMSLFALLISAPVEWRRCHSIGRSR
jgi:hypothetical protein